jgi:hypothetical protein
MSENENSYDIVSANTRRKGTGGEACNVFEF